MEKVLSFRFQQCFSPITMLFVEGSSETGVLRLLSKHVFRDPQILKYIRYESHVFLEMFKMKSKFRKYKKKKKKKIPKGFFFWDNFLSIFCYKLCLLRREYLSSAANGLTDSPKILHITQRNFFNLNCLRRYQ